MSAGCWGATREVRRIGTTKFNEGSSSHDSSKSSLGNRTYNRARGDLDAVEPAPDRRGRLERPGRNNFTLGLLESEDSLDEPALGALGALGRSHDLFHCREGLLYLVAHGVVGKVIERFEKYRTNGL